MDLVENVPSSGATGTVVAEWNPTYSTPECQSVVVVVNPCYGVLDVKAKHDGDASSSSDPAYDTPGARKEQDKCQSDPGYESIVVVKEGNETVHDKKDEMNGGDPKTDISGDYIDIKKANTKKDENKDPSPDSNPDEKMKVSDVKNVKVDGANLYGEPGYASPDVQTDEIEGASSESAYAKPDKKRETNDVKVKDSIDPDAHEEPGYETPDIAKEETDGTRPDATYAQPERKRSEENIKRGQSTVPDLLEEPGYATPDLKMEDTKGSSSDATYAKPDKKRSEGNFKSGESIASDSYEEPGYEILKKDDTVGTTSDTTYAKPDKKKKEVERQNHPGSDNSTKNDEKIAEDVSEKKHMTGSLSRTWHVNSSIHCELSR